MQKHMRKYFGTDGVRGIANDFLTSSLAYRLGRSAGILLSKKYNHKLKALIGTDTRISKDMIKSALVAGFTSVGVDVTDLGIIPTPAVAYLVKKYQADFGVVVSASHNPMEYNGIKFFNSKGLKLEDDIELEIENNLENDDYEKITHEKIGTYTLSENAIKDYEDFLISKIHPDLSGYKIVLDCANGASYKSAPEVFKKLGADVVAIGDTPDGININDNIGSTHPKLLCQKVVEEKADFGLAFDGDADRLIACDENGQIIDGDKILLLISKYLKSKNELKNNTLVVTVMSNMGLFAAAKELGINLETTAVGDRYVLENMLKNNHIIGGEQSGHIILLDHNTTGDGTMSAIMLANVIKDSDKKASDLAKIMDVYPQVLLNVTVDNKYKTGYKDIKEVMQVIENIENLLSDTGRVLIRPSGTEPYIRVMLEGKDLEQIQKYANEIVEAIKKHCV